MTTFYRSALGDRVFLGGWILLAVVGQAVIPVEAPSLEWLAVGWVALSFWMVRNSACLPLLILTCPLFLCAPPHPWAWALPTWSIIFILRLLADKRCGRKEFLWIVFWGALILACSWPRDSGPLLVDLKKYGKRELLTQWLRPEASWAIFAFRHSFDRALVAGLAAALILIPGYIKTIRIWRSLFGAGIMALGAAYAAALLPWQQPHLFLGTLNLASSPGFLFHGAGYNPCYLPFILAVALPWFLVPLHARRSWAHLGLLPLFLPTIFLNERIFLLSPIAIGLTLGVLVVMAMGSPGKRRRLRAHWQSCVRQRRMILAIAACSMLFPALWCLRTGALNPQSPLRATLYEWSHRTDSVWVKTIPHGKPPEARLAQPGTSAGIVQSRVLLFDRLEIKLSKYDPSRAYMWVLGMRHSWEEGFWRGSGAGTWAKFHYKHRITRIYYEHMHNTFLNLIFEYGVVPMVLTYLLMAFLLFRLLRGINGQSRAWLLYFAGLSAVAMGFDLFYFPFSNDCLVLLGVVVLAKSFRPGRICDPL